MTKDQLLELITEVVEEQFESMDPESRYRFAKFYGDLVDAHGGDRNSPEVMAIRDSLSKVTGLTDDVPADHLKWLGKYFLAMGDDK